MKPTTPQASDETLSELFAALERASDMAGTTSLQHLLGSLERLKAIIWARLFSLARPGEEKRTDPLEDLRHLTPIRVAELLGLKEAYVHELCRSRRIPAVKQGKYWMIAVADLREWLARPRKGIDPDRSASLPLPDRLGVPAPTRKGRASKSASPSGGRLREPAATHLQH